ncbi:MAG TPA: hypothetical protein VHR72_11015 [Gemmataceae bacterium]|jgi:hypothetical protein|nr:hypothetical protein [Gemmataceae bacterium]
MPHRPKAAAFPLSPPHAVYSTLPSFNPRPAGKGVLDRLIRRDRRGPPDIITHRNHPIFVQLVKDFQGQKAGTRIDVTEPDAKTLLDAGLAARIEGDQLAPLVQKSMEGMLASITDTLTKSIDAVLKQFAMNASAAPTRLPSRPDRFLAAIRPLY